MAIRNSARTIGDNFNSLVGFRVRVLPLVAIVGLLYLTVTTPNLANQIASLVRSLDMNVAADGYDAFTAAISEFLHRTDVVELGYFILPISFLLALLVLPAGAIRSLRVGSAEPVLQVVGSFIAGLLILHLFAWAGMVLYWLFQASVWLYEKLGELVQWAMPFLQVVGLVLVGAAALCVVGWLLTLLVRRMSGVRAPGRVLFGLVALVALVVAAGMAGWLDVIANAVAAAALWVAGALGDFAGWLIPIVLLVVLVAVALMVALALFGHIGRNLYLPFATAGSAGWRRGSAADLAGGLGIGLSLIMLAFILDPAFASRVTQELATSPLCNWIPIELMGESYAWLMPDHVEQFLQPAFDGFIPLLDCAFLALVSMIGATSLVLSTAGWVGEGRLRVVWPVLIAMLATLPLIILSLLFADRS